MLIALGAFLVILCAILGVYWALIVRPEQAAAGVVKQRLRGAEGAGKKAARSGLFKPAQATSAQMTTAEALLHRSGKHVNGLQTLLEQSGSNLSVPGFLLMTVGASLVTFFVVQQFVGWTFVLVAVAAALIAAIVPYQVIRFMRSRRLQAFEDQFPEALDLMSRSLRAGHAFTTGIEMVASEMPKPAGPEFRLLYDQQNYGMSMTDALHAFAHRIPVLDARFFVTAVLIQRESGGNLSEVLDNLASVMRERHRVKRQMRVLSAHGRITGWILVCLPPALFLALSILSEEHRNTMFGEKLGIQMMLGAAGLQVIGTLIMRKIVNIEY